MDVLNGLVAHFTIQWKSFSAELISGLWRLGSVFELPNSISGYVQDSHGVNVIFKLNRV
jgi:hypothetical protein